MNQLSMNRRITIILPGLLFFFCSLNAQQDSIISLSPIEADRPDQTETASLVPKGYFQMENGFSIEDTEPGFIYTHPSTLWKVGVSEYFELRVITEYINIQLDPNPKVDGFLPVKVGFKSKLFEQNGLIPKTSFIGHLSIPGLASKQFQQTYFAPDMRLAFQYAIGDRYAVGYNFGAEWDGETPRPDFIYTLSVSAGLFSGLSVYAEGYGSVPQQREDDAELRIDGGFTYLVSNDVLVDISGGIGITDNAPERYVAIGLSYRFKM